MMRLQATSVILLLLLFYQKLGLSASLNSEGRALLRFRERIELDPYGVLAGWGEEKGLDPCSWFGVGCDHDGRVVSLNLKDLYLEGTLADDLGKLTHMESLILRNNSFYGTIPREIGELQKLVILDLGYNNLMDPIPVGLGSILSLEILILTNNKFTGTLHEFNTLYGLQIDKDHLSSDRRSLKRNAGNGIIRKLLQLANKGNGRHTRHEKNQTTPPASPSPSPSPSPFLAPFKHQLPPSSSSTPRITLPPSTSVPSPSPATSPSPISEPPSPVPDSNSNFDAAPPSTSLLFAPSSKSPPPSVATNIEAKHKNHYLKIYLPIALGMSFILASVAGCILCFRANKVVTVRPWATGLSGQLQKAFVTGVPSLKRSEMEVACEDFSNVIGSVSNCMVYKGTLSSGVEIAVMSSVITSAKDWSKQSQSHFRKKISTLSKVNHKNFVNLIGYCEESEPFTRMMVFEYAPNGTLFEHLHIREAEPLDWAARLRVAMGVAYCLEYMHQLIPPVILEKLDSSSIYLTDDYAAKISDLGFMNTTAKESESLEPPPTSHSEIIVYKFGIILLELLSGRLPFSEKEGLLEQWASCYLTGKRPLSEMVDPSLQSVREEDISALCTVIQSCVDPDPKERLAMAEIVRRLRDMTAMTPEGATPKLNPLWWAELEIMSSEVN